MGDHDERRAVEPKSAGRRPLPRRDRLRARPALVVHDGAGGQTHSAQPEEAEGDHHGRTELALHHGGQKSNSRAEAVPGSGGESPTKLSGRGTKTFPRPGQDSPSRSPDVEGRISGGPRRSRRRSAGRGVEPAGSTPRGPSGSK